MASLNCHLHLMYSTKPNSQVYKKARFCGWGVLSHNHIQTYNKVQLLCATKSWTHTSSYTLAFDQFLLWFQLGGVAFFLSFWRTRQKYNHQTVLTIMVENILYKHLRNVFTKTFYANVLYFFPFLFACAFQLISLANMVGELCSCFYILICRTQARVSCSAWCLLYGQVKLTSRISGQEELPNFNWMLYKMFLRVVVVPPMCSAKCFRASVVQLCLKQILMPFSFPRWIMKVALLSVVFFCCQCKLKVL